MTIKAVKEEARRKLALNMHQAIVVNTIEFALFITLVALVVMSAVSMSANLIASIVMICYGSLLAIVVFVCSGIINFAMVDFYLATYRCKPYNIRRLGDTLARAGITKIFLISLKRALLSFLLLLCLIVPGVIYMIRTSMANYLLIANPKMKASAALSASNKVMSGKTGGYFALCMSLTGWYLLGLLTLGLGYIFILPYTNLIKAVYYKRNLQGDKTVYQVVQQPVSPPPPGMQGGAATVAVTPDMPASDTVRPVHIDDNPAPIDTLEAEDIRDMNETMRDLDGVTNIDDIPEVAISPVSGKKNKNKTKNAEPAVEPIAEPVSNKIEGTNLVESQRELTSVEISAAERAHQSAIEAMYSPKASSQKAAVDYFGSNLSSDNESPDDFVTDELTEQDVELKMEEVMAEPDAAPANAEAEVVIEPVVEQAAEPVVEPVVEPVADAGALDNEFDALLHELDTEQPAPAPKPEPEKPFAASASRPSVGDRPVKEQKTAERERRSQITAAEIAARAERIKREREERLKNSGK